MSFVGLAQAICADMINQQQFDTLTQIKNKLEEIALDEVKDSEEAYELRWLLIETKEKINNIQWSLYESGSKLDLDYWTASSMDC